MSKEKPIHIRLLSLSDLQQFYFTFLEAFRDYGVDMTMDRKAFDRRMLDKLSINWSVSVGAFSGDKMVGFIAHTTNTFQNELYLYNGGTGVIPEYRGLKLTEHMYHLAIRQMHQLGISRCILEVIDNNNFALASYTKIGFNKTRMLRCYKLKERSSWARGKALVLESLQEDELKGLPDTTIPSFMDCWDQLSKNRNNEKVLLLRDPGELIIGYCVLNPGNGRIARLWVREENRRAGVGRSLIGEANRYIDSPLTVINVDENNRTAHQFLIACGFENQINQWEMMMQIG